MHTPEEGLQELEYAVKECGHKVLMLPSYVRRPVAAVAKQSPEAGECGFWLDTYGLDSAHDYDPFWARCIELKAVPTFHSLGIGWEAAPRSRTSFTTALGISLPPARRCASRCFRGRDTALSDLEIRLSRVWGRLGMQSLLRPRRALGEAKSRSPGKHEAGESGSRVVAGGSTASTAVK